jgi:hypothetical protein
LAALSILGVVSTLLSALEELRAEDLGALTATAVASDLDELERASRIVDAELARRLAEFERWPFGIEAADSRAAAARPGGATRIMSGTGPMEARPRSTTSSCGADRTIG